MTEEIFEPIEETIEEITEEITEEPENYRMGKVTANKLYVRSAPTKESADITTIKCGQEVMVDLSKSANEFYNVVTEAGIEGYCMKHFIALL